MTFSRPLVLTVIGLLAVMAVAAWVLLRPSASPMVVTEDPTTGTVTVSPPASFPPGVAVAMPEPAADLPPPRRTVMASPEAVKDIEDVQFMLRDFRARLGGNPGGTNAEIMKAVMGGNSVQARLGPPEGQRVNSAGELVDRWEVPYFFHQLSAQEMEVRSAGPDRTLYTNDDIVVK